MFISFEGIDGSGKSTQVARLASTIRAEGRTVRLVREPGGTRLSESIRSMLLDPKATIHPTTELFLFTAARAQLVHEVIQPALASGEVVIADRYTDSTLAYQGAGRGVCDLESLRTTQTCATSSLEPNLTFILDLAPEEALRRRSGRDATPDRMESADLDFYRRVRTAYLELATQAPHRIYVLDALLSEDDLEALIASAVTSSSTRQ